ncbi:hypothetical protein LR003_02105 [candidate division NPL-UPA2 bacterium]|nr:hypothetical protein [candidate division NPL-UPA2 bacterium]
MSKKIKIRAEEIEMEAALNDSQTAEAIWKALPVKASANTWGEEIYFSIPVKCEEENAQEIVSLGDLGYWPPGRAFCIFFGRTPASQGEEIRPASPVNIVGKILGDPKEFKKVSSGSQVTIEVEV